MKIIKCDERYLAQLVPLFEEYRAFCQFAANPTATEAFLAHLLRNNESVILIAIEPSSDRVMGFVNLYPSYSTLALQRLWILNDLGVSGDFRGRGVSKALLNAALAFVRDTGAIRVELKTETTNQRALALYESVGFSIDNDNVYYRVPLNNGHQQGTTNDQDKYSRKI